MPEDNVRPHSTDASQARGDAGEKKDGYFVAFSKAHPVISSLIAMVVLVLALLGGMWKVTTYTSKNAIIPAEAAIAANATAIAGNTKGIEMLKKDSNKDFDRLEDKIDKLIWGLLKSGDVVASDQ